MSKSAKELTPGDPAKIKEYLQEMAGIDAADEKAANEKAAALNEKYHDVILKTIKLYLLNKSDEKHGSRAIIDILSEITGQSRAELPAVLVKQIEETIIPLDKVNKNMWYLLEHPTGGQITFDMTKYTAGNTSPVYLLYSLDFSKLENVSITRKLEPYDKRVYLAIGALFNAKYDCMSIQQIYNAMGYTGRAGTVDIKKINDAITKMNMAHLYIDNKSEAQKYVNYKRFKYDGALLPMERVQAIVNGQTTDAVIHIFREPPMITFARQRKQITTVNIKLLDTPLSKTNANLELEDYFLEEIAHIKRGGINSKMLFTTIYARTHITERKQKQRAPEKIRKLLDYYKQCGYISGYQENPDGITIFP